MVPDGRPTILPICLLKLSSDACLSIVTEQDALKLLDSCETRDNIVSVDDPLIIFTGILLNKREVLSCFFLLLAEDKYRKECLFEKLSIL